MSSQLLYLETRVQASHQAWPQTDVAQLLRGVSGREGAAGSHVEMVTLMTLTYKVFCPLYARVNHDYVWALLLHGAATARASGP